jgi:hypothetical protein
LSFPILIVLKEKYTNLPWTLSICN